jgi:asparagine synthase (glutamine-hydrolysing)
MSGFVAIVDPSKRLLAEASVARMLGALASRGDRSEVKRDGECVLAVTRFDWELAEGFSGPGLVVTDGHVSVVADATLYYRDDLLRALRSAGVRPSGPTVAHLIAAAYRAWSTDCTKYLEGDFAFVAYDHAHRGMFAARDFTGRRPLYYAEVDGALLVASSVRALVAHPSCPTDLDDVALAELASVSLAGHSSTPYSAISAVPAASALVRDADGVVRARPYWHLSLEESDDTESFDTASEQLGELLSAAVIERRALAGPTTIWLSGGYDSSAMYGVGNAALDRRGLSRLAPVSFSYPVGDAGREDELITEIANFWATQPTWLSIDDVPLLANAAENAARADIPFQHAFENWIRALLGATARGGSRVALFGDGGDQLFAVSTVFLRDLFGSLRWRELRREWRAFGGSGARALWRSVVRPTLADRTRAARGKIGPQLPPPTWIRGDFVAEHGLARRQLDAEAAFAAGGGGDAAAETRRSLGNPIVPRVAAGFSAFGLEHGIELRAPLLDRRIVEFALRRPRHERASAGAVKHLLRHSAREFLPSHVLAPRKSKTGVLTDYFARSFRADPDGQVSDIFSRSILAERGIVDGAAMQHAWHEYKTRGVGSGGHLFIAFQIELWLSARAPNAAVTPVNGDQWIRMPAAGFVQ